MKLNRNLEKGMHEIRNKKRLRPVKSKKAGIRLMKKTTRRATKVAASLVLGAAVVGGSWLGVAMLQVAKQNDVDLDFVTVSYPLPTDGSTPDMHSGIENIGYMNTRFRAQTKWYSEMHGVVDAAVMSQSVETYKQYDNKILIQSDLTKSGLVNDAKQFCFVGDEVLIRTASGSASSWDGLNTTWNTGAPKYHLTVEDYIPKFGLPGTEFSVYAITEDTLLSADEVIDLGNGTYSQTYYLDCALDKAPAHYANAMIEKAALSAQPSFTHITVTYVFDSTWQVLSSLVDEGYVVTKGISINCSAEYYTEYEYGTTNAESAEYENYYKNYVNSDYTNADDMQAELTAADVLSEAFGSLLVEPTSLSLSLTLNGQPLDGVVYLDVPNMDIRADFGDGKIKLWYSNDGVYLSIGGLKVKANVNELIGLFGGDTATIDDGDGGNGGLSLDDILADLGSGNLTYDDSSAFLETTLHLFGLSIPVEFSFSIGENRAVTLEQVQAEIELGAFEIDAKMGFCNTKVPTLTDSEKAEYIELMPYVKGLLGVVNGDALDVGFNYSGNEVTVTGSVNIVWKDGVTVSGSLNMAYKEIEKALAFAYVDEAVYLDVDGLRIRVSINEAIAFISNFVAFDGESVGSDIDLAAIIGTLLSDEFLFGITASESGTGEDSTLNISVKLAELLKVLGGALDGFDEVSLSVSENGVVRVGALGAEISVKAGNAVTPDTDGYVNVLTYIEYFLDLFSNEALEVSVSYEYGDLSLNGVLTVDTADFSIYGTLTLTYADAVIPVTVTYYNGDVYLDVYGIKVKTNPVTLIEDLTGSDESPIDFGKVLQGLLGTSLSDLIELSESDGVLGIILNGNEILKLFGVDFNLGELAINVQKGSLTIGGFGAKLSIVKGEKFDVAEFAEELKDYADVEGAILQIIDIVKSGAISLNGEFVIEVGDMTLSISVRKGVLSWKNGIEVYLDLVANFNGIIEQEMVLKVDAKSVKVAFGNIGVHVVYEELSTLDEAFVRLYNKIRSISESVLNQGTPMPEIDSFATLLEKLEVLTAVSDSASGIFGNDFNLAAMLESIVITSSEAENGICRIGYGDFILDIVGANGGELGLILGCSAGNFSVNGSLGAKVYTQTVPELPEITYLSVEDFAVMLDYVGAAVQTIASKDITLTLNSTTTDVRDGETVYTQVNGKVLYHTGDDVLFVVDTEDKTVTVTTNLYLNVSLQVITNTAEKSGTYLDLLIFDYNNDKELDFFVTLSQFDSADEKYEPLKLYAPAGEIMTLLAAGIAFTGVNLDFLNNWFVYQWLSIETSEQLMAIGSMLKLTMGFGDLADLFIGEDSGSTSGNIDAFVSALQAGDNEFVFALDSFVLYGEEGLNDVTLKITKTDEKDVDGNVTASYLTGITLSNIYNSGVTQVTDVTLDVALDPIPDSEMTKFASVSGFFTFNGLSELLKVIAHTITHEESDGEVISGEEAEHNYVLNKNFYIQGSATAAISMGGDLNINVGVTIDIIAVSVNLDENGNVGINLRLQYAGKWMVVPIINGDTTLDMTIKNGMVYMKRVQSTETKLSNKTINPITKYRVMPLDTFFGDIMNQLGFMLNFGSSINNSLASIDMGSGSDDGTPQDYGTLLKTYLTSFGFETKPNGSYDQKVWTIVLNGNALTGGAMSDITIVLGTDEDDCIRYLDVDTSVAVLGSLTIDIDADLTLCNPRGVMDSGVKDNTQDIASELETAVGKALRAAEEAGWVDENGNHVYIEGVATTVTYAIRGTTIYEQTVMYDGQTNVLYADLVYPDLSEYEVAGYTLVWNDYGTFVPNLVITADYVPNEYRVTFLSDRDITGFNFTEEDYHFNDFTYSYLLKTIYIYEDGFYYAGEDEEGNWYFLTDSDGNRYRFPFPEVDETGWCIEAFYDRPGNAYRTDDDCLKIDAEKWLMAKWVQIDYTITYEIGENIYTQTAHYGEAFKTELSVECEGYTFDHWVDVNGTEYRTLNDATVTGETTFTAVYVPNVYMITLVSDRAAEGFVLAESGDFAGSYIKTIEYIYGEKTSLPNAVKTEGYFLNGFALTAGETETFYTVMPQLAENAVLYAVWKEIGFEIKFVANGAESDIQNYLYGETLSNLPEVPFVTGYTGTWQISENYVVTGDDTIYAVYTKNTYTVSVISEHYTEGAVLVDNHYVTYYDYVYDTDAVVLPVGSMKVPHYDFVGYFTKANGAGTQVTELTNEIISTLTLYAYYLDNTVTVILNSDYKFDGSSITTTMYYTQTLVLNDEYSLSHVYGVSGYQQLGWWYEGANGWEYVLEVSAFKRSTVTLWAMWVGDLSVEVTKFDPVDFITGTRYTIQVTMIGGKPANGHSATIAEALGLKRSVEAKFYLYNGNMGSPDNISSEEVELDEANATLTVTNHNSLNYADTIGQPRAVFGGATVEVKFTYGNETVSSMSGAFIKLDPYTVTFVNGDGKEIQGTARTCALHEYGLRVYADELAEELGIIPVSRTGYTVSWPHTLIDTDGMRIEPVYVSIPQAVRFECAQEIEGWAFDEYKQIWFYEYDMNYNAVIHVYEGEVLLATYVVTEPMTVTLPAYDTGRMWTQRDIFPDGAEFGAFNTPDTISYSSSIAFTYNGETFGGAYGAYTRNFENDLTLLTENSVSAEGYVFLGWFVRTESGWERVESIAYSRGNAEHVVVEALWYQLPSISLTTKVSNYLVTRDYKTTVTYTAGQLVGNPADGVSFSSSVSYDYYYDGSLKKSSTSTSYNTTGSYSQVVVKANVTFTVNGLTVAKTTVSGSAGF